MKIKFKKPGETVETGPRWQVFIRPMSGLWYTRELPQLDDGEMIEFVCDYARRSRLHCALALRDRWTLWIDPSGAITGIETRTPGGKNRPFMQADDDPKPFIWVSDLAPDEEW